MLYILHIFLAIAAIHCMTIHELDVKNAFMCAPLLQNVYMHAHPAMNIVNIAYCLSYYCMTFDNYHAPEMHIYVILFSLLTYTQCARSLYIHGNFNSALVLVVFVNDIQIASASDNKDAFH